MMQLNREEIARDLLALGSVPFLVLVVVRIAMAGNSLELFHIVVAVLLFTGVSRVVRGTDYHVAVIVILTIFTSVFYDDPYYTAFAAIVAFAAVYACARILDRRRVLAGVLLGLACSGVSYLLSLPLNIRNI